MSVSHAALSVVPGQPLAHYRLRAAPALAPTRSDTCSRIVDVAEQLFRQLGHRKTTVADIARALSMSPANIYRFFPSKEAINEAVCRRLLGELICVAAAFAQRSGTAKDNLHGLLVELARINAERRRTSKALHQLLVVAASENWPVVADYAERLEAIIAAIIGDGMRRGEFRVRDAWRASRCICAAMSRDVHPSLVVCDDPGRSSLGEIVDFCLAALGWARGEQRCGFGPTHRTSE
jgi:AcrR family transcriptional regulator